MVRRVALMVIAGSLAVAMAAGSPPAAASDVRRDIVRGQRQRLADFGDDRTARELDGLIAEFA